MRLLSALHSCAAAMSGILQYANLGTSFFLGVIYCGPVCRKEANDTYHKYECGITDVIHKAQIGGWALAYRAITTHPFEYFLENKDKFLNSDELLGSKNHDEEV